ncbi:MAG: hypothetical protein KDA90_21685 [Planctomycetaceae bacterium]|nr:hypothetical protein [Planctomycetaceae bacterium]
MITHRIDEKGNEIKLTLEERRRINLKEMGLSYAQQEEIEAREAGEIGGDCIALDDDGNEVPQKFPKIWEV